MKILLAPSKSQHPVQVSLDLPKRALMDEAFSRSLMMRLKSLDRDGLAEVMQLSPKLAQETYRVIEAFDPRTTHRTPALWHYTGVVFDQLTPDRYTSSQLAYIDHHLRILSALYGLVHPFSPIWAYRLDFTMKLDWRLKAHWKPRIAEALACEDMILDLSSHEFSSLLDRNHLNLHRVEFAQRHGDRLVITSTLAKQARGALAHQLILTGITEISAMRALTVLGHRVDASSSTEHFTLFIK
jgi:uncharacterized protein